MLAYKLFTLKKDGLIYPLFINKKVPTVMNTWIDSECFPTKGFAIRNGWHCCFSPTAPHLKEQLSNGQIRVWVECNVEDYTTYHRPECQGGTWILAHKIKVNRILKWEEVSALREEYYNYHSTKDCSFNEYDSNDYDSTGEY